MKDFFCKVPPLHRVLNRRRTLQYSGQILTAMAPLYSLCYFQSNDVSSFLYRAIFGDYCNALQYVIEVQFLLKDTTCTYPSSHMYIIIPNKLFSCEARHCNNILVMSAVTIILIACWYYTPSYACLNWTYPISGIALAYNILSVSGQHS